MTAMQRDELHFLLSSALARNRFTRSVGDRDLLNSLPFKLSLRLVQPASCWLPIAHNCQLEAQR